jgi:hypothetical protein
MMIGTQCQPGAAAHFDRKGAAMKLTDVARVIRSKNAGPTTLTVDLMFNDATGYERALAAPSLQPAAVAQLYGVAPSQVEVIPYPPALAIKIVMDRRIVAGTPGDRDVYGAQQHGPMLEVEL